MSQSLTVVPSDLVIPFCSCFVKLLFKGGGGCLWELYWELPWSGWFLNIWFGSSPGHSWKRNVTACSLSSLSTHYFPGYLTYNLIFQMSTWNVRTGQIVSINIHLLCQDGIEDVYLMSSECADKLLLLTLRCWDCPMIKDGDTSSLNVCLVNSSLIAHSSRNVVDVLVYHIYIYMGCSFRNMCSSVERSLFVFYVLWKSNPKHIRFHYTKRDILGST